MNDTELQALKTTVKESDLIGLWQYFENRASALQERLWNVFTFNFGLLISLAAYLVVKLFYDQGKGVVPEIFLFCLALIGTGYAYLIGRQLANIHQHIYTSWADGSALLKNIEGLPKLFERNSSNYSHPKLNLRLDILSIYKYANKDTESNHNKNFISLPIQLMTVTILIYLILLLWSLGKAIL